MNIKFNTAGQSFGYDVSRLDQNTLQTKVQCDEQIISRNGQGNLTVKATQPEGRQRNAHIRYINDCTCMAARSAPAKRIRVYQFIQNTNSYFENQITVKQRKTPLLSITRGHG